MCTTTAIYMKMCVACVLYTVRSTRITKHYYYYHYYSFIIINNEKKKNNN